ncbi:L domain-like protein [Rhizopogon salebrosus TDB-379]|nr:L domain-like protein [Rhizopogon salebrosus TDB-379]
MKFLSRSQLLGPTAEELTFDEFEIIDLTGCNASSIVYLNLSCNPMVEIPLDFIQSCVTLRDLRLSSMAMKKVPQSVRYSTSLHRLDLSCNRIVDLDDAGLDRIPELSNLRLQNNGIGQLPWYFPRLKFLKFLNILNNKFVHVPDVIRQMPCLVELDMSFNTITELPKEIGRLTALEHLFFVGNQVTKLPKNAGISSTYGYLTVGGTTYLTFPSPTPCQKSKNSMPITIFSMPFICVLVHACRFWNDITFLKFALPPHLKYRTLTVLDVSYAKLSSLDTFDFSQLPSLRTLNLDHNELHTLRGSLGELSHLSLTKLPISLWNCASLMHINVTSNLPATWHDPPGDNLIAPASSGITLEISAISSSPSRPPHMSRKPSSGTLVQNAPGRPLPPLAHSLE